MPILDVHLHTSRYSPCSLIEAGRLAAAAAAAGLDGIIITEHGKVWPAGELAELARDAPPDFLILAAQEVRASCGPGTAGDILVYGSGRDFPPGLSPETIIDRVHRDGGVAVAAHPYRGWLGLGDRVRELPIDGIEAPSGNAGEQENEKAAMAARELGLPALGGSDAHVLERVGLHATEFHGSVASMEDVVSLIRAGRCSPAMSRGGGRKLVV